MPRLPGEPIDILIALGFLAVFLVLRWALLWMADPSPYPRGF